MRRIRLEILSLCGDTATLAQLCVTFRMAMVSTKSARDWLSRIDVAGQSHNLS